MFGYFRYWLEGVDYVAWTATDVGVLHHQAQLKDLIGRQWSLHWYEVT